MIQLLTPAAQTIHQRNGPNMSDETLLTAARRVVRFIRIDDHHNGGLLSIETIQAANTLAQQVDIEERRQRDLPSPTPIQSIHETPPDR